MNSDIKDNSMEMKISVEPMKYLNEKKIERMNKMKQDGIIEGFLEALKEQKEKRIEDSYVCDCNTNYGGRCLFPEKYRTTGCNGKGEK